MANTCFQSWLSELDELCWALADCSYHDLADADLRSMYDDEYTPHDAAIEVLEAEGLDVEEFV